MIDLNIENEHIGLKIYRKKRKYIIILDSADIELVQFYYLKTMVIHHGGLAIDEKIHINKAKGALIQPQLMWRFIEKLCMFHA